MFAAGVFSGMCDLLSSDIKKELIVEKTFAQDKFIPRSSLYLGYLPWLVYCIFSRFSGYCIFIPWIFLWFFKRQTCELVEVQIYFYEQTKITDVAMLWKVLYPKKQTSVENTTQMQSKSCNLVHNVWGVRIKYPNRKMSVSGRSF